MNWLIKLYWECRTKPNSNTDHTQVRYTKVRSWVCSAILYIWSKQTRDLTSLLSICIVPSMPKPLQFRKWLMLNVEKPSANSWNNSIRLLKLLRTILGVWVCFISNLTCAKTVWLINSIANNQKYAWLAINWKENLDSDMPNYKLKVSMNNTEEQDNKNTKKS